MRNRDSESRVINITFSSLLMSAEIREAFRVNRRWLSTGSRMITDKSYNTGNMGRPNWKFPFHLWTVKNKKKHKTGKGLPFEKPCLNSFAANSYKAYSDRTRTWARFVSKAPTTYARTLRVHHMKWMSFFNLVILIKLVRQYYIWNEGISRNHESESESVQHIFAL